MYSDNGLARHQVIKTMVNSMWENYEKSRKIIGWLIMIEDEDTERTMKYGAAGPRLPGTPKWAGSHL